MADNGNIADEHINVSQPPTPTLVEKALLQALDDLDVSKCPGQIKLVKTWAMEQMQTDFEQQSAQDRDKALFTLFLHLESSTILASKSRPEFSKSRKKTLGPLAVYVIWPRGKECSATQVITEAMSRVLHSPAFPVRLLNVLTQWSGRACPSAPRLPGSPEFAAPADDAKNQQSSDSEPGDDDNLGANFDKNSEHVQKDTAALRNHILEVPFLASEHVTGLTFVSRVVPKLRVVGTQQQIDSSVDSEDLNASQTDTAPARLHAASAPTTTCLPLYLDASPVAPLGLFGHNFYYRDKNWGTPPSQTEVRQRLDLMQSGGTNSGAGMNPTKFLTARITYNVAVAAGLVELDQNLIPTKVKPIPGSDTITFNTDIWRPSFLDLQKHPCKGQCIRFSESSDGQRQHNSRICEYHRGDCAIWSATPNVSASTLVRDAPNPDFLASGVDCGKLGNRAGGALLCDYAEVNCSLSLVHTCALLSVGASVCLLVCTGSTGVHRGLFGWSPL
jgi:hypothetical protein